MEERIREWNSELSYIEVCDQCTQNLPVTSTTSQMVEELADGHAAVRVGAATTNLEMLNWSNK